MVKHLDDLDDVSREIVKTLRSGRSHGLTTPEIHQALTRDGYQTSLINVKQGIGELIEYGSVRGYAKKGGDKLYYLSRGIGSGGRNHAKLMGNRNLFSDTYKFLQRMFGVIFVLFGLGFIVFLGLSLTGNVVLVPGSPSISSGFYLSFMLALVGGVLLYYGLKK